MRVVIDTNVFISGIFFGGNPRKVLETILNGKTIEVASVQIIEEYREVVRRMIEKKGGKLNSTPLSLLYAKLELIDGKTKVNVCRDPDDDKFLACAVDGAAYYVVSGDSDLLSIGEYRGVKIVTANEFLQQIIAK